MISLPFRFDPVRHVYVALDTGETVPNISRLLDFAGLVNTDWYTDEHSDRGTKVHMLAAAHDLAALDPRDVPDVLRPWIEAHITLVNLVQPEWLHIEVAAVHPTLRFAGRLDRLAVVDGHKAVWEIKSGAEPSAQWLPADEERDLPLRRLDAGIAHRIQTALQAILAAPECGIPERQVARYVEYITGQGKFKIVQHTNLADFDRAHQILRDYRKAVA